MGVLFHSHFPRAHDGLFLVCSITHQHHAQKGGPAAPPNRRRARQRWRARATRWRGGRELCSRHTRTHKKKIRRRHPPSKERRHMDVPHPAEVWLPKRNRSTVILGQRLLCFLFPQLRTGGGPFSCVQTFASFCRWLFRVKKKQQPNLCCGGKRGTTEARPP